MGTLTRVSFVAFGIAALLAPTHVARAQTFYGAAGGVHLLAPDFFRTFTVQASIGWRISRRLETRVDAFGSHEVSPWSQGGPSHYIASSVAGLAGNVILNVNRPVHAPQAYLIGGLGVYCLGGVGAHCFASQVTYAKGLLLNLRFGPSLGVGGSMPMGRRSRMFLEARFHSLISRRSLLDETHWLLPITLGIRL